MKKTLRIICFSFFYYSAAHSQVIGTFAGNNSFGRGYSGDGGPATLAELSAPLGIVFDTSGNFYFADDQNWIIRKVDKSGTISTFAGNYYYGIGYSGDGGPATGAELSQVWGLCIDKMNNIYLSSGAVIRSVSILTNTISTFAGNHLFGGGYSGDGGPATLAELCSPSGVALDTLDNLYIVDQCNQVIRKVSYSSGIITTVAGNHSFGGGFAGDGGPATLAELASPEEICTDISGNLYISDIGNFVIRKVNMAGIITTFAGNHFYGPGYSGDGGTATLAELYAPRGLAIDSVGNLFFADIGDNVIREVNTSGIITTIAGNYSFGGGYSGDGGLASNAELNAPNAVTFDKQGNLYISDGHNFVVRKVSGMLTGANKVREKYCGVRVYPNPTSGKATIQISCNEEGIMNPEQNSGQVIEVYNVFGQCVYLNHQITKSSNCQIDLSGQPDGVYFYRVESQSGSLIGSGKLVVER